MRYKRAPVESDMDLKPILVFMQRSLMKIPWNVDAPTYRMAHMSERMDKPTERFDQVKRRVSKAEDEETTLATRRKKVNKFLLILQSKADDREACSCRNNVLIVGVEESTCVEIRAICGAAVD
ncbi:hypothetical protein NDU88_009163 [Pleurodeles waltl]|uniref:Uncharacterized protein n=1 Tax=Pleurodeles waltl TaxID=8319 RepID=A0AAV7NY96_PLEWA|nr:hypothetical protein NDU88_009163 [Pleurodeles waltl]